MRPKINSNPAPFVPLQDQAMLARWQEIDALEPEERERILSVVDSLVRDAKARQAYRMSA